MTPLKILEDRLQLAAQRMGLRVMVDRRAKAAGQTKYLLRPYWDARRAVRMRLDGTYEVAVFWKNGRRHTASPNSAPPATTTG